MKIMKTKKQQENKKLVSVQSINEVEATQVGLVFKDKIRFDIISARVKGGSTFKKGNYGQGPLAYIGDYNKNETIFIGINKADPDRFIIVFKGESALNQLSAILNEEQFTEVWLHTDFNRVQGEFMIPLTSEMETALGVDLSDKNTVKAKTEEVLKGLAVLINESTGGKPKAGYSKEKNILTVGSDSSVKLNITIEKSEKTSTNLIMVQVVFNNTTASNMHAAVMNSTSKTLKAPISMFIEKTLSVVEGNPIMDSIKNLCKENNDSSVLLSKRDRGKLSLNSKVKYFKGALTSMLKHIEILPVDEAKQYSFVLVPFMQELVKLSKTNEAAYDALFGIRESMSSQTVTSAKARKTSTTVRETSEEEGSG